MQLSAIVILNVFSRFQLHGSYISFVLLTSTCRKCETVEVDEDFNSS